MGSLGEWRYRGEGSQNLVLSHDDDAGTGVDGGRLEGTAVRVRKRRCDGEEYALRGAWPRIMDSEEGARGHPPPREPLHGLVMECLRKVLDQGHPAFAVVTPEWLAGLVAVADLMNPGPGEGWDGEKESAVYYAYRDRVLSPLLGAEYVPWSVPVSVDREALQAVENYLNTHEVSAERPPKFREQGPVQLDAGIGIVHLMPDLKARRPSGFQDGGEGVVHVFELKPKCGFLPTSPLMDPRTAQLKRRHSSYVMQQRLKMKGGSIQEVSGYDPLDLFSGRRDRISSALSALAQCPQNNFSRVDVDTASGLSKELTWDGDDSEWTCVLQALADALVKAPLLGRLRTAQEALDGMDVEGVGRCFMRLFPEKDDVSCDSSHNIPLTGRRGEAATCVDAAHPAVARCLMCMFLTKTVLKDVSIVVRLRRLGEGNGIQENCIVAEDAGGRRYEAVLSVLDLDVKPANRIPLYLEKDRAIVSAFADAEAPEEGQRKLPILFPPEG